MELKGAGPYFQRSMSNTVLAGLLYQIFELYLDDVLIHGRDIESFLANVRKDFKRSREFNVAVNPAKTKLGLSEVEYVDHVLSATEMTQPLRKLIPAKKYKGSPKLVLTPEAIETFEYCRQTIANSQELFFLEDTATPILQTDAAEYGIGGYVLMMTGGKVRVVRFFSE